MGRIKKIYKCDKCSYSTSRKSNFIKHISRKNPCKKEIIGNKDHENIIVNSTNIIPYKILNSNFTKLKNNLNSSKMDSNSSKMEHCSKVEEKKSKTDFLEINSKINLNCKFISNLYNK